MNKRYQAYLKTTDNPTNHGYIDFNSKIAEEYKSIKGETSIKDHDEFTDYVKWSARHIVWGKETEGWEAVSDV